VIRTNTSPNTNTVPISRIAKEVGISVGRTHQGQAGNGQKKSSKEVNGSKGKLLFSVRTESVTVE
jgi:hypothetical protein|tara:strand:- start:967 stop:1161 length:195 start_codon:yes stop_codon:yes gene_type:complete